MEIKVFDEHGCAVQFSTDEGSSFVEVQATAHTGQVATVWLVGEEAYHLSGGCASVHRGDATDATTVYGTAGVVELGAPGGTVSVNPDGEFTVDDQAGNSVTLELSMDGLADSCRHLAAGASQI